MCQFSHAEEAQEPVLIDCQTFKLNKPKRMTAYVPEITTCFYRITLYSGSKVQDQVILWVEDTGDRGYIQ